MLDLAAALLDRLAAGRRVAAITVTGVARSAPRGIGATMAVTRDGEVIGSISGGCVEGDAVALAQRVMRDGSARTGRFGFDDDTAHAAGLACGGVVDVVAYEVRADDRAMVEALRLAARGDAVTVGLDLSTGSLVDHPALAEAELLRETRVIGVAEPLTMRSDADDSARSARGSANRQRAASLPPAGAAADPREPQRILALSRAPRPRLLLLGATEHAAALCRVASAAGYAVTVVDAWDRLATRERFPDADDVLVGMPHEILADAEVDARTAVVVMTHDTRLDIPALAQALSMPVGFVGALGARSTVARRAELLLSAGVDASEVARIHSPLGLDLGGSSPEATAVAALAEIIAARHGGSGRPLRDLDGPIHAPRESASPAHLRLRSAAEASRECGVPTEAAR